MYEKIDILKVIPGTVFPCAYICDRKACKKCNSNSGGTNPCCRTTDFNHAVHKNSDGIWVTKITHPDGVKYVELTRKEIERGRNQNEEENKEKPS